MRKGYEILIVVVSLIVLVVLSALLTGCNQTQQTKVWSTVEPTAVWQEYFGNDNISRFNFEQTQVLNRQGNALAELDERVAKCEKADTEVILRYQDLYPIDTNYVSNKNYHIALKVNEIIAWINEGLVEPNEPNVGGLRRITAELVEEIAKLFYDHDGVLYLNKEVSSCPKCFYHNPPDYIDGKKVVWSKGSVFCDEHKQDPNEVTE